MIAGAKSLLSGFLFLRAEWSWTGGSQRCGQRGANGIEAVEEGGCAGLTELGVPLVPH